ncbi:MAG: DUF2800 domain-containing protein [Betaproteobacteria bacterium]|nr:DUF2800 domain-containing protein [Betaproteobacteria bacterium]
MFTTHIGAKAWAAMNTDGEFVASEDSCKFCPAKGICSAYATQGLVALPEKARVIDLPHAGSRSKNEDKASSADGSCPRR